MDMGGRGIGRHIAAYIRFACYRQKWAFLALRVLLGLSTIGIGICDLQLRVAIWVGMDIVVSASAFEDGRREAFS